MGYNRSTPLYRFSLLLVLSVGLMIIDHRSSLLSPVRIVASIINIPFELIVGLPSSVMSAVDNYYPDSNLHDRYLDLQRNQAIIEARLQRYEALEKENERLAQLLSASRRSSDEVLLAEIIDFGLQPFNQKLIINRGVESGVYLGQPAIAPLGILGQVSETGYRRSVITLISDASHGLPVQILRNGLRTIVHGSGKQDRIILPYLDSQADIRQGDVLVTSGMGGRFPVGYRVAEIISIVKDANEAFLDITAQTTARVAFTKEVLLLWNAEYVAAPGPPHSENPQVE